VDFFACARGTRAHVRNVPSSVLPKSTVAARAAAPPTSAAQKRTPHPHPPNNTERGPGICPKSPKSTRINYMRKIPVVSRVHVVPEVHDSDVRL
jgi:hypothetical protein